jgi:hypothetical protein
MRLRYDPFTAFVDDLSPLGMHIRHSVLRERNPELAIARREFLARLKSDQMPNGSWKDRVVTTIENLYYLLILDEAGSTVGERAVDWLLDDRIESGGRKRASAHLPSGILHVLSEGDGRAIRRRRDLITNRGCSALVKTGAALYFSAFFNLEGDPRVIQAFRGLDHLYRQRRKKWCTFPCSNNILRAYVSHPLKKSSRTTKSALARLEQLQTRTGIWKGIPDFYHTLNIVASSSLPAAVRQFERTYEHLHKTQNQDGTWGRTDQKFKTFLVLDALVRQGFLAKRHGLRKFVENHRRSRAAAPRRATSGPEASRSI